MILDNEAKAALLNATAEAESYLKGIYCGICSLLCGLGLEELYLDWVSEPAEEIDSEEGVHDGTPANM